LKKTDVVFKTPVLGFCIETCRTIGKEEKGKDEAIPLPSGFGGLEVACWPLEPKFAGPNPTDAVEIFRAKKKSSARLPSEGK